MGQDNGTHDILIGTLEGILKAGAMSGPSLSYQANPPPIMGWRIIPTC